MIDIEKDAYDSIPRGGSIPLDSWQKVRRLRVLHYRLKEQRWEKWIAWVVYVVWQVLAFTGFMGLIGSLFAFVFVLVKLLD